MDQTVRKGCSGYTLKIIAVVTMLIDHLAATVLLRNLMNLPADGFITMENYTTWVNVYEIMRLIGRMAFPIYCFLLVEGFLHTRNIMKYMGRMALFVLLSEIPFDLAINGSFFEPASNSVFLTLLIGLITIGGIHLIQEKLLLGADGLFRQLLGVLFMVGVFLMGMWAADLLHTDYASAGIAAIVILYVFRNQRLIGFAIAVAALGFLSSGTEFTALLMLIPMYFYNGTRGRQVKYFFYAFYPVHLLILAGVCYALGLGV